MIKSTLERWTRQQRILVVACVALAFAIKLALAWNTYGTNDILTWDVSSKREESGDGAALYRNGNRFPLRKGGILSQVYNHPPPVFLLLRTWRALERTTGVPMSFWMRATDAVADVGAVLALIALDAASPPILAVIALSPVAILVSGFHGNTDPLLLFFLVCTALAIRRGRPVEAGLLLGCALDIKFIAILLIPAILFHLQDWPRRVKFAGACAALVAATWAPYWALDPIAILRAVAGYSSVPGYWGISSILSSPRWPTSALLPIAGFYSAYGKYLVLGLVLLISWRMRRRPLYEAFAVILFTFLVLTPGFGVQYLCWLVPWLGIIPLRVAMLQQAVCGTFLFAVYTFWSGGIPWYFANSFEVGMWHGSSLRALEFCAWITVCICLFAVRSKPYPEVNLSPAAIPAPAR